jgi:hypothetical protein
MVRLKQQLFLCYGLELASRSNDNVEPRKKKKRRGRTVLSIECRRLERRMGSMF